MADENALNPQAVYMQAALEFLKDARRLVAFQQAIGIEGYPRSPALSRFVSKNTPEQRPAPAPLPPPSGQGRQPELEAAPGPSPAEIFSEISGCRRCPRHQSRSQAITGEIAGKGAKLMIIADTPSAEDDLAGAPMSGEPGRLLEKMLAAIGLKPAEVHLSLLIRCHGPQAPEQKSIDACLPFLKQEIALVAPKIICVMGQLAAQKLLNSNLSLLRLRGRFHETNGLPLMPTFAPDFLLKNPEMKKAAWQDLQMIQKKLQAAG